MAAFDALGSENVEMVRSDLSNLGHHLDNIARSAVPILVGINRFIADTDAELDAARKYCEARSPSSATHRSNGSAGDEAFAEKIVEVVDSGTAAFRPLYLYYPPC